MLEALGRISSGSCEGARFFSVYSLLWDVNLINISYEMAMLLKTNFQTSVLKYTVYIYS